MSGAFASRLDFLLHRFCRVEKRTLLLYTCLALLLPASMWCFIRSVTPAPASSSPASALPLSPVSPPAVRVSKITAESALFRDSRERARRALVSSAGRDPFFHSEAQLEPQEPPAVYAEPPALRIRGLLVSDAYKSAMLEVDGVALRAALQEGNTFDEGRGEIVAIDREGVSWFWNGSLYRTSVSSF